MRFLITLLFACCFMLANGQELVGVTQGADYEDEVYYKLSNDDASEVAYDEWDIAFSTTPGEAGIFINEATPLNGVQLELYVAPTADFGDVIDPNNLEDRLYNDEIDWEFGAFNAIRDENNSDDYGWGTFNEAVNAIEGDKIFAIRFRNGSYKKLQIESLENDVYTVKIADLDGANELTFTLDKSDFSGEKFAYYSFAGDAFLDDIQAEWDLLFTRYVTLIPDNNGDLQPYLLTGVLSGVGVETAQANIVDTETVDFNDYEDSLSTKIDIIGHDWKEFNLGTFEWTVKEFRAYFVKTAEGEIWKIVFKYFSGSSSGLVDFEKTLVGSVTAVEEQSNVKDFGVFPNPMVSEANLAFSLEKASTINVQITDLTGKAVWTRTNLEGNTGFNMITIPDLDLPTGTYFLSLFSESDIVTEKIIIK